MTASDVALLCSGTATLEAALMGLPMVILYKVSPSSWAVVKFLDWSGLIESKTLGLPNLVLKKRVVPELIQHRVTPSAVTRECLLFLNDEKKRKDTANLLKSLRDRLGDGTSVEHAAHLVLQASLGIGRIQQAESKIGIPRVFPCPGDPTGV
jgi:lipid-A-disaccharide synthase